MSPTFDRRAIMTKAHARVRSMMKVPLYRAAGYRKLFAAALQRAWSEATADRREAARHASNIGLPLRSCPADAPAPRASAAGETRVLRFGSARVFAGPGAREAAIESVAARVGGRFQHARNQGRRAEDWA